jgi:tetratricopeptide (TPR) repeat protein
MKLGRIRMAAVFLFGSFAAYGLVFPSSQAAALPGATLPTDASSLVRASQNQFDAGNYAAAITTLQSAISQNPTSAEAHYWLGRCYAELHDYDNAVKEAEKSVAIDDKSSLYHLWLGRAYGDKADRDRSLFAAKKAKAEWEKAVQLDPRNIVARRDLEEYCLEAPWIAGGSKDEANSEVSAIAALDPIQGYLARAVFHIAGTKKLDLAENEYRQVLLAKPKAIDAYIEVIEFFGGQNKPSDMETAIQGAAQVSPNDPRLAYFRGVERVLSNTDLARAEEYLKSYIASTPNRSEWPSHAGARVWLGRMYEAQGKRAEAAEQYRAALQLDPGRKDARARLEKLEKSPG